MTTESKPPLEMSPLCQTLESNGKSVAVKIYSSDHGQWILEVVDEFDTSTVWEDPFKTDQAALEEVLDTIKTEGIECLIGQVPQ
ncbi:MAG: hypothetical protein COB04_09035 [Gammaproteobacteria bacterium]|nr:MAG: hypothetical protein COB04_09035 [Gammaproteobacteria bacterium]